MLIALLFLALAILAILAYLLIVTRSLSRLAEQSIPPAGQFAKVSNGTLHYTEHGPADAPALVLIHGLSGQLQHFSYALTGDLAQRYRVISVDRPGCGYSERDNSEQAALTAQADAILELIEQLNLEKPIICGHSMGGAVALTMGVQSPEKIRSLALLAPLTHLPATPSKAFAALTIRSPLMRRFVANTLAAPMAKRNGDAILTEVFHPEPAPADFPVRAGGLLSLRPRAFVAACEDFAAASGIVPISQKYRDLSVPGVVLYGAQDVILSAAEHGPMMADYGLEYRELPNAGHMIPMTAAADCIAAIDRAADLSA